MKLILWLLILKALSVLSATKYCSDIFIILGRPKASQGLIDFFVYSGSGMFPSLLDITGATLCLSWLEQYVFPTFLT